MNLANRQDKDGKVGLKKKTKNEMSLSLDTYLSGRMGLSRNNIKG